ncbi:unnamed protein product [Calypogeia fissa]
MGHGRRFIAMGTRIVGAVSRQCGETPTSTRNGTTEGLLNSVGAFRSSFSAVRPSFNSSLLRANRFSCCAKVDLPPPREIIVEYEEKSEHTDYFIELADGIENANPELMVLGNPDDMQPRDGSFEVTTGQHVLFSKLQAQRLPRVEEILLALEQLPTEALSCELETNEKAATA